MNWLFFWPLALYSLLSAWNRIDPAVRVGEIAEAQRQVRRVRTFGIIGLCVGCASFVLSVVLLPMVASVVATVDGSFASLSARSSAQADGPLGKILRPPSDATPWVNSPTGVLDLPTFVDHFYAADARADETKLAQQRGFVSAARNGWINADRSQTEVVLIEFRTPQGAESMYLDLTQTWRSGREGGSVQSAPDVNGTSLVVDKLDSLGNAHVRMTAPHGNILVYVRHFTAATPDPDQTKQIIQQQLDALN
ncbi:hypothetical protein [Leifsonia sp. EB41]|uniref:hypothetical protein n=1 Tax=Leifsonia sp. EB41 TaxID=3156260 RepID=UPI003513BEA0